MFFFWWIRKLEKILRLGLDGYIYIYMNIFIYIYKYTCMCRDNIYRIFSRYTSKQKERIRNKTDRHGDCGIYIKL